VLLNQRMHAGHWDKATHKSMELEGRTVGVVGLGAIGLRFARLAQALGMRVVGHDPAAGSLPDAIERVPLAALWPQADVISLHCPLLADNRRLVNAQTLAACKPGVVLINTARGGLVDEAALLQALRTGHVAAAGLDSFEEEPLASGHPFQGEPRLVLSPHVGGVTREAYVKMGVAAVRNALAILQGPTPAVRALPTTAVLD
jgi:D-3-phosphoglycerate dehydrogenase / 2-oxoglutarate reductase